MGTSISYNGNSLQTSSILTDAINHHGSPDIEAKYYNLAHANRSYIPYIGYPGKTISISGTLVGTSISNLDSLIDTFKSYLTGIDNNLDIGYASGTRRYVATVNKIAIDRPRGLSYAIFQVDFECSDPFGRNTSTTTALSASGRTSSAYSDNYTFLGTSPFQSPIVTITITAITGGTSQYIQWGNNNTGQVITVIRTWSVNDILVIDCAQKTVTVNGTAVAFTGAFPIFAPGAQTLQYNDGFTTRTFTISVVYTQGFL